MRYETQKTICEWAEETFGPCSADTAFFRCAEEFSELENYFELDGRDWGRAIEECADVLITLYRVAECLGEDLHAAVNRKMAINRNRKWKVSGGVGQHEDEQHKG